MNTRELLKRIYMGQIEWARANGLNPNDRGYLSDWSHNLFAPLTEEMRTAFSEGSGGELEGIEGALPKMCSLCSSSALAVNIFAFWASRDLSRMLNALAVVGTPESLRFESKLPTGAPGTPPHLDVTISLTSGGVIGVESKFTEWLTPKRDAAAKLQPYVHKNGSSYWSRAALPRAHQLVRDIVAGRCKFEYLDAPQLLKHALGLRRAAGEEVGWQLRYLFLDQAGSQHQHHLSEIDRFVSAVGDELRFRAMSYQSFVPALGESANADERSYFDYVNKRYLLSGGRPA
jgi:hypothetical protein